MHRRKFLGIILLTTVAVLGFLFLSWGRPPQLGEDAEVFRSVDALYTAVTARDERLLEKCDQRLRALKEAGKMPAVAADHLGAIVGTARQGRWQAAAERLYDFMKAQKRERGMK